MTYRTVSVYTELMGAGGWLVSQTSGGHLTNGLTFLACNTRHKLALTLITPPDD